MMEMLMTKVNEGIQILLLPYGGGMTMLAIYYALYIAISAALTVWVAHSLSTRGRVFLVQFMDGNQTLADSVNHLLVIGFYLINLGYAMLALSYGPKPHTIEQGIEWLSFKVGLVLVVLGATHFFNMAMITKLGYRLEQAIRRPRASNGNTGHAAGIVPAGRMLD
jgi:hypothetical protein